VPGKLKISQSHQWLSVMASRKGFESLTYGLGIWFEDVDLKRIIADYWFADKPLRDMIVDVR